MYQHRRLALIAGGLAVLLGALDTYVVITIVRDLMADVGIPINKIQQVTPIITAYLLFYVAAMPLLARASDRFGRKILLQISLVAFGAGSVMTALAHDLTSVVIGRSIQGFASGALLPVTLALGADLWSQRNRVAILGTIGAAQELGSLLGPLYGIAIVWLLHSWRDIFWINIPLTVLGIVLLQISLPAHDPHQMSKEKIDLVGGILLALSLGLAVVGLYNPQPDAHHILPAGGQWIVVASVVMAVVFIGWEKWSPTKLIHPLPQYVVSFWASIGSSVCAGGALMAALVDIELFGQGVLGMEQNDAARLLSHFLVALPVGALLGGWVALKVGDRFLTCGGLIIAACGYWRISHWRLDILDHSYQLFAGITLSEINTDQMIAGFGLGVVIGPLTSAMIRTVPACEHGIASSLVVVARTTGMLIGMSALSAWGFYRLNQILLTLPKPVVSSKESFAAAAHAAAQNMKIAFSLMYGEIFTITAVICLIGALLGLLLRDHCDDSSISSQQFYREQRILQ